MKRLLMLVMTLSLFSAALVGCRAEGELDVDDAASTPAIR